MLDFPNAPTVGQKFPSSPIVGIPSYTWDGEKWTTAVGTASGGLAVLYDKAQSLTALNQQQARQNIYAAPFDAMAYGGLQINGGMEVSQENGTNSASVSVGSKYILDGWNVASGGVQVLGCRQNPGTILSGFNTNLEVAVATANASPAAADYCTIRQFIEGYRIRRLAWGTANAQPIMLSFWVVASRAGLHSGCIRNGASNRGYTFTFTVNIAGAWEYKTVTIPGDTAGTWASDNTIGLAVHFSMMSGSSNQGAAGAWGASVFLGATGTANCVAATSDYFLLTGVIVIPGNEAPSAARSPFVMRPFAQELEICKRYYEKSYGYATLPGAAVGAGTNGWMSPASTGSWLFTVPMSVEKRAAPTFVGYDGAGTPARCSYYAGAWSNGGTNITFNGSTPRTIPLQFIGGGASWYGFDWTADARL